MENLKVETPVIFVMIPHFIHFYDYALPQTMLGTQDGTGIY